MRSFVASILLALCVSGAMADGYSPYGYRGRIRERKDRGYEKAGSYASGSVYSDGGHAYARASGSAQAFAAARSQFSVIINDAIAEVKNGGHARSVGYGKAEAIAYAITKTYAEAYAEVYSSSKKSGGCASAFGSAHAAAHGYAEAYVDILAEAANKHNLAAAHGDAHAIGGATAEAFSQAEAEVCTHGKGGARAYQKDLAYAIVKAYASALVDTLAGVRPDGTTYSDVKVDSYSDTYKDSGAKTDSHTDAYGDDSYADAHGQSYASIYRHRVCRGYAARCCYSKNCKNRYKEQGVTFYKGYGPKCRC